MAVVALPTVAASPVEAAVGGIKGRITLANGAAADGVAVDLFTANADGSRGRYLQSTRTGDGYFWFGPADGCYVVTMIAPTNDTFTGGARWFQRPVCVNGGQTPGQINATLASGGGGGSGSGTPVACTGGQPIWNLVFEDQFSGDGAALGSGWRAYNSTGNAGYGLRRPAAISQWGGTLNIRAAMENGTLVSGGLSHTLSQKYGRYEFRVRTDKDPSSATSGVVLTWPQSGVHPRDGENNVYETLATPADRHEFYSFIHKPSGTVHDQDYTVHSADASQWHTMVMEWAPDKLVIYRDGQAVKTISETGSDLIPDNPHYLAIQLDAWKHSLSTPVWMQLDYVKVWSYGGKTSC